MNCCIIVELLGNIVVELVDVLGKLSHN